MNLFQEAFRYLVYKLLDKTSAGLEELAGDSLVTNNKSVLAYVSGLGFGLISGVRNLMILILTFLIHSISLIDFSNCQYPC